MLEQRLTAHMDYLLKDDKVNIKESEYKIQWAKEQLPMQLIAQEGIESLSLSELQQAVEERGM